MAVTYSQLSARVLRVLNDPDANSYEDDILYDGVIGAHEAILPWVPKWAEVTLTSGSDGTLHQLPDDLYDVQAVQILSDGKFISRATLAAGTARGNTYAENDWIESPKGWLSLSVALEEGDELKVYYLASWGQPSDISDISFVIEVPSYAHLGLVYFAASHCISQSTTQAATLGQYKQKVDAGTPIQNSMKDLQLFYRQLFYQEMKTMPPYAKAHA